MSQKLNIIEGFFFESWLNLSEKTRSVIENMFFSFSDHSIREPLQSLFCKKTTVTPKDVIKGKIIVIDLPVLTYEKTGQNAQILWKYIFQRAMQRRQISEKSRITFLWADEAQYFLHPNDVKPEGPFGDHLGYYSLIHDFPVLKVKKVYAKENAIWPFTVVGRPPQEDSQFGALIHAITGKAIEKEIPGLKAVNAVDDSGVHPLLLAVGYERYTPYNPTKIPQELLTIANHVLGTGQMSLAKYLFICDEENAPDVNDEKAYFTHFLERVNWQRDLHFQTKTTIDTLDYSGDGLNEGSKVVIAAAGEIKRELDISLLNLNLPTGFSNPRLVSNGNLVIEGKGKIKDLITNFEKQNLEGIALITLVDNATFTSENFSNWLWITFTRSNPANDIYGLNTEYKNKHFSCSIPIIDARIKGFHALILER